MRDKAARASKRTVDVVGAACALLLLTPVLATVAILVRLMLGAPVIFSQVRPGLGGRPFTIFKFRTMTDTRDPSGQLVDDAARLTQLGQFLRGSSLDELPGLLNVLRGEMSLVGPRPLLMEYLDRYTPEQARRHEVKPGLTGWAQVNGRNAISWEEKFALDVWYVDNHNLWVDLKILVITARKVWQRDGISKPGHATTDYFRPSSGERQEPFRGEQM